MDDAGPPAPPPVTCQDYLQLLEATVRRKAQRLIEEARSEGIFISVHSSLRTYEEQARLYAKGRTTKGPRVTNARPGYSWHNFGRAFDVHFLVAGKTTFEGPWTRLGEIGERVGLEWGGRWESFPDVDHFQDRGGMSLAQARDARKKQLLSTGDASDEEEASAMDAEAKLVRAHRAQLKKNRQTDSGKSLYGPARKGPR